MEIEKRNDDEGRHETPRDKAVAQLPALNAAEAESVTTSFDVLDLLESDEKQAEFKRYTYNGVTVQATGRRSSDRDGKAWMRTVRSGDNERVVHYADPDMLMRRNNPGARKNFLARHGCSDKSDPFSPGFWACYDWANPSEKELAMDDELKECVDQQSEPTKECDKDTKMYDEVGPTSFADLDAAQQAIESVQRVGMLSAQFQMIVRNIMADPTIENKGTAVQSAAGEFAQRVDGAVEQKAVDDLVLKELHYKEVVEDDSTALESDFQGGCQHCGFGDDHLVKMVRDCPCCWNTLEVQDGD